MALARQRNRERVGVFFAVVIAVGLLMALRVPIGGGDAEGTHPPATGPEVPAGARIALSGYIAENRGQAAEAVRYYVLGNPSIAFRDDGVLFLFRQIAARDVWSAGARVSWNEEVSAQHQRAWAMLVRFEGAAPVRPQGIGATSLQTNYFLGRDPARWTTHVPTFGGVAYRNLYEGVDLVYRMQGGVLKYEFTVQPGADSSDIRLRYEGITGLEAAGEGLLVRTPIGAIGDAAPLAYEASGRPVPCAFAIGGGSTVGFDCAAPDPGQTLIIDPAIYSTLLGGAGDDGVRAVAVDAAGNAYLAGWTWSPDFPVTPGAYDTSLNCVSWSSGIDAFVSKLAANGSALLYSTFLGGFIGGSAGCALDQALGITIDSAGSAYIAGVTLSTDFPTTPGAFGRTYNRGSPSTAYDGFVTKLNASGDALAYSTYLGGIRDDFGVSIAVDGSGHAYVTGETTSADLPVTPDAFDTTCGTDGSCNFTGTYPIGDAFAAEFAADGSGLVYSTFLGGEDMDVGYSIAIDAAGEAFVTGATKSMEFPTTPGANDSSFAGGFDAFIVKLNASGTGLAYGTYLGMSGEDSGNAIAVDDAGRAYVYGVTASTDFPTTAGAFDGSLSGPSDAFVAKLDATGEALAYSTLLGGDGDDGGWGVAVDSAREAQVIGWTNSTDFPVTADAVQSTKAGMFDTFVSKLDADGGGLLYSTYLGGSKDDLGYGLALDPAGDIFAAGQTWSDDFPTTAGAFQTSFGGACDGFVAKLLPSASSSAPGEEAELLASDGAAGDEFGTRVALDGDTAVVGAPFDDDEGVNSGSAYVFIRRGTTWTQEAKVLASDGAATYWFGFHVGLSGDTAVVGAPHADGSAPNSGAAYVFVRTGATWTQEAKLVAGDGTLGDQFGLSVDVSGDTMVVGAPSAFEAGIRSGSAYVFTRTGGAWTQQAKLVASGAAARDEMGSAVAIDGDRIVVGSLYRRAAHVFARNGTAWAEEGRLVPGDAIAATGFGWGLDIRGDLAIAGAFGDTVWGEDSGSAYVFGRTGGAWTQQAKLVASDGATRSFFGYSVAIGENAAVVGAYGHDGTGAAYLFEHGGTGWTEGSKLAGSDAAYGDTFGRSVAIGGDTVLVSASGHDHLGLDSGSAYVYRLTPPAPSRSVTLDINPDTLNPKSRGRWITAYFTTEGAPASDIDPESLSLNGVLAPAWWDAQGDDTLMVKFDRAAVESMVSPGDSVAMWITGRWRDGESFEARDIIRVIG